MLQDEEDLSEIGQVTCPATDDDKECKCVLIEGEVKGKFNILITSEFFCLASKYPIFNLNIHGTLVHMTIYPNFCL